MGKNVFVGIDLGTTGIKLILIQDDGVVIDKNYADYPISQARICGTESR